MALRLGHSIDMLMTIYAGLFEDERRRASQLIDGELANLGRAALVPRRYEPL